MGKHNDGALKQTLEKGLRTQFLNGLRQGTTAICAVVRDKASDTEKSVEERLDDIIRFCNVSLNSKEQE